MLAKLACVGEGCRARLKCLPSRRRVVVEAKDVETAGLSVASVRGSTKCTDFTRLLFVNDFIWGGGSCLCCEIPIRGFLKMIC